MGKVGLIAMFAVAAGSVMVLSACGSTKKADITPTTPAVAGTPSPASSPPATPQPAAITISSPQQNDKVTVPITVSGTASVFEGALIVAIESSKGDITFCRATTTASEGAPGTGTFEVMLAFPPPPFTPPLLEAARVHVFSQSPKDGSILGEAFVPIDITGDEPNIVIKSPLCDALVTSPVTITGTASVFEASLMVAIKDSSGNELASAHVMASEGAPAKGTFSQDLTFSLSGGLEQGTIEAYSLSPKDGSVINLFSVPVLLRP